MNSTDSAYLCTLLIITIRYLNTEKYVQNLIPFVSLGDVDIRNGTNCGANERPYGRAKVNGHQSETHRKTEYRRKFRFPATPRPLLATPQCRFGRCHMRYHTRQRIPLTPPSTTHHPTSNSESDRHPSLLCLRPSGRHHHTLVCEGYRSSRFLGMPVADHHHIGRQPPT